MNPATPEKKLLLFLMMPLSLAVSSSAGTCEKTYIDSRCASFCRFLVGRSHLLEVAALMLI